MAGSNGITRRKFLTGAVASAAVVGLAGCSKSAGAASAGGVPNEWDAEADVVVLGSGVAGHIAACTAAEEGASVLILEKATVAGGDTALCKCIVLGCWPDRTTRDSGKPDSIDSYITDYLSSYEHSRFAQLGRKAPDDHPFVTRQAEAAGAVYEWLEETVGTKWEPMYVNAIFPALWDTVEPRIWVATNGMIPPLAAYASKLGVEIMLGTPATGLIRNTEGRVVGVRAVDSEGNALVVKANKAVVVATGNYISGRDMVARYMPALASLAPTGSPTNSGDGCKMVQEVGGALKEMDLGTHHFIFGLGSSWSIFYSWYAYGGNNAQPPGILVNYEGKRFVGESLGYNLTGQAIGEQKCAMAFYVVDSTGDAAKNVLSQDEQGSDVVLRADTLDELAAHMGVDAEAFKAEVTKYNGFVAAGKDTDFGKNMEGTTPILNAPFYAMPCVDSPYQTYGGIATDLDSHVLDAQDDTIAGLYAVGTCTGVYATQEGVYYNGGVIQGMVWGRLAGKGAATEKAWS